MGEQRPPFANHGNVIAPIRGRNKCNGVAISSVMSWPACNLRAAETTPPPAGSGWLTEVHGSSQSADWDGGTGLR